MLRFLRTAFPEFRLRAEGKSWSGARWVHVGTDQVYSARLRLAARALRALAGPVPSL